jgi:hypothetical protein
MSVILKNTEHHVDLKLSSIRTHMGCITGTTILCNEELETVLDDFFTLRELRCLRDDRDTLTMQKRLDQLKLLKRESKHNRKQMEALETKMNVIIEYLGDEVSKSSTSLPVVEVGTADNDKPRVVHQPTSAAITLFDAQRDERSDQSLWPQTTCRVFLNNFCMQCGYGTAFWHAERDSGSDHCPRFRATVEFFSRTPPYAVASVKPGFGNTKKKAEEAAVINVVNAIRQYRRQHFPELLCDSHVSGYGSGI